MTYRIVVTRSLLMGTEPAPDMGGGAKFAHVYMYVSARVCMRMCTHMRANVSAVVAAG